MDYDLVTKELTLLCGGHWSWNTHQRQFEKTRAQGTLNGVELPRKVVAYINESLVGDTREQRLPMYDRMLDVGWG